MSVLLYSSFNHPSSDRLYGEMMRVIQRSGMPARFTRQLAGIDMSKFDVLIGHNDVTEDTRRRVRCFAGRQLPRPVSLQMLQSSGVPTMEWSLANTQEEVFQLFDRWKVDRIFHKKSFTCNSAGVQLIRPNNVNSLTWNFADDIFCKPVNLKSADDELFKAEIFNGEMIISWMRSIPQWQHGSSESALPTVQVNARSVFTFPGADLARFKKLSIVLTKRGFGYCSIDLMKTDAGDFVAIELNTSNVATWWTAGIADMRNRYINAVTSLLGIPRL